MEWTEMSGKFLGFVRIYSAMAVQSQNIDIIDEMYRVRGRAVIPVNLGYLGGVESPWVALPHQI
jgi:hypothetical protein